MILNSFPRLQNIDVMACAAAVTEAICNSANKLFSKSLEINLKMNKMLAKSVETRVHQIDAANVSWKKCLFVHTIDSDGFFNPIFSNISLWKSKTILLRRVWLDCLKRYFDTNWILFKFDENGMFQISATPAFSQNYSEFINIVKVRAITVLFI